MDASPFIIETERLRLREFLEIDGEDCFWLNKDHEVIQYTGDEPFASIEEAKEFLNQYSEYGKNGFGRWTVLNKEGGKFLGWCGLKLLEDGNVDLGYRFYKKYWNQGFATEAAKACLDYGFNALNLTQIIGRTDKKNQASIKVLEKIGMHYWKEDHCKGIEDALIYRVSKNQFLTE